MLPEEEGVELSGGRVVEVLWAPFSAAPHLLQNSLSRAGIAKHDGQGLNSVSFPRSYFIRPDCFQQL
jgi:hypothetical protein